MIVPLYESNTIIVPAKESKKIYKFSNQDSTTLLESFSFFCGDERAYQMFVKIMIGSAEIKPFNLLKGYRRDNQANLFLRSEDILRIYIENQSEISMQVDMQLTLRKYG